MPWPATSCNVNFDGENISSACVSICLPKKSIPGQLALTLNAKHGHQIPWPRIGRCERSKRIQVRRYGGAGSLRVVVRRTVPRNGSRYGGCESGWKWALLAEGMRATQSSPESWPWRVTQSDSQSFTIHRSRCQSVAPVRGGCIESPDKARLNPVRCAQPAGSCESGRGVCR